MSDFMKRWYPLFLVLAAAGVSLIVFSRLPERMATHWDLDGNANGWMPRGIGALFAPVMMLAMWGILRAAPMIDPRRENYEKFANSYDVIVAAVLTLLFVAHIIVLALGLGYHVNIAIVGPCLVGVLFVVIGNVLPLARSNFMYGIRTPWTLSNDRVWARTHRLGGYMMTGAGLVMIAGAFMLPTDYITGVIVGSAVAAVIAPVLYSYLAWKREMKG